MGAKNGKHASNGSNGLRHRNGYRHANGNRRAGRNGHGNGRNGHGNGNGPVPPPSDRELVQSFQAGSEVAYEEIYRRYGSRVRWLCSRMLGNQQDAEEAAQETFLKAYTGLERFNGRYQLKAWLSRIAVNVCLDEVRSRARNGNVVTLPSDADFGNHESSPEEVVTGERLRLDSALQGIQPLHAHAILLRGQGHSHKEIADRLDMTPAQVKALLHRARRSFDRAWRRVEGWALAPVGAFRSLLPRRSDATQASAVHAPQLVMLTNGLGAGLAERVAAAGVAVTVALTGSSGIAPPAELGAPPRAAESHSRPAVVADGAHAAQPGDGSGASSSSDATAQKSLTAKVEAVVEKVGQTVRPERERPQETEDDDGEESPGSGPSAAGAASAGKKAKDEVRRTAESLPRPLP